MQLETKFYKIYMQRSKEVLEDLKIGERYKNLLKRFGVHIINVKQNIYKWKTFGMMVEQSRIGRRRKISARASKHQMVKPR